MSDLSWNRNTIQPEEPQSRIEKWLAFIAGSIGGTVDTEMSDTSGNAVQNKVIKEYVDGAASGKVSKSGDTVNGSLAVEGDESVFTVDGKNSRADFSHVEIIDPVKEATFTFKPITAGDVVFTDNDYHIPTEFRNNAEFRGYILTRMNGESRKYLMTITLEIVSYTAGGMNIFAMNSASSSIYGESFDDVIGHVAQPGEKFTIGFVTEANALDLRGFGFKMNTVQSEAPYSIQIKVNDAKAYELASRQSDVRIISGSKLNCGRVYNDGFIVLQNGGAIINARGEAMYYLNYHDYGSQYDVYLYGDEDKGSTVVAERDANIVIGEGKISGLSAPINSDDAATKGYVDKLLSRIEALEAMSYSAKSDNT